MDQTPTIYLEPDDEPQRGKAGQATLTRSELKLLAREAGRYPMTTEERRRAVEACVDAIQNAKNPRGRLAGVKALAALDKINLDEDRQERPNQSIQVNVDASTNLSTNQQAVMLVRQAVSDDGCNDLLAQLADRLGGLPAIGVPGNLGPS